MDTPKVYADFQNADASGRLRLNCSGTTKDLESQSITLREGLTLVLYSDDADENGQIDELIVDGIVEFSADEQCWVAGIDWSAIRHVSESVRGNGHPSPIAIKNPSAKRGA